MGDATYFRGTHTHTHTPMKSILGGAFVTSENPYGHACMTLKNHGEVIQANSTHRDISVWYPICCREQYLLLFWN